MSAIQSPTSVRARAHAIAVAIYARVSTANQVGGRFDSCESQAAVCRDFIAKHAGDGWFEVACFSDPAYSGGSLNRPGIRALMRQIEAGEIKVVVIFKLERVLRSTSEWAPFRAFLKAHGCQLVSVTEDISEATPSGRLKNNIVMSVNEYERDNTAEKIRIKLNEQAKRGFWTGGQVPFGYVYDEALQGLSPHLTEAATLRRIFEMAAKLTSLTEIANTLNDEGLRTRARIFKKRDGTKKNVGEKRFRSDIIRRLITRPLYAGRVRMNGKEFPGLHAALVTDDLWERANAGIRPAIQPAARRFRNRDKHFHLLKGVAHCGCCGRAMIPNASGKLDPDGKPYRYYTCGYAHKERSDAHCPVRHVSATALETAVVGFLGACSQHPDVLAATTASARERRQTDRVPLRVRLSEVEKGLTSITEQLRNCAKALVLGNVAALDEVLREQAGALQTEKQRLLVEREQVRLELAASEEGDIDTQRVGTALEKFGELLPTLSPNEQRDLVMLFVERVEVRPSAKPAPKAGSCLRLLELRLKLRVGRLIEGMSEQLVIEERTALAASVAPGRPLILTLNVALAPVSGAQKPVTLLTPFRCELGFTRRAPAPKPELPPVLHPIHRARAWQRRLDAERGLNRIKLAAEEGLAAGSITHHMKLLELAEPIQAHLLNITSAEEARRFGLNRMKALAELPLDEQVRRFAALSATVAAS
ncbi:MAG: recombinase family protein [Verrucomicrobia bacterium]|nr:recombinase family protein [Verrucomicrobiota bacterium]